MHRDIANYKQQWNKFKTSENTEKGIKLQALLDSMNIKHPLKGTAEEFAKKESELNKLMLTQALQRFQDREDAFTNLISILGELDKFKDNKEALVKLTAEEVLKEFKESNDDIAKLPILETLDINKLQEDIRRLEMPPLARPVRMDILGEWQKLEERIFTNPEAYKLFVAAKAPFLVEILEDIDPAGSKTVEHDGKKIVVPDFLGQLYREGGLDDCYSVMFASSTFNPPSVEEESLTKLPEAKTPKYLRPGRFANLHDPQVSTSK